MNRVIAVVASALIVGCSPNPTSTQEDEVLDAIELNTPYREIRARLIESGWRPNSFPEGRAGATFNLENLYPEANVCYSEPIQMCQFEMIDDNNRILTLTIVGGFREGARDEEPFLRAYDVAEADQ